MTAHTSHTPGPVVRFAYENGAVVAYMIGPKGGKRKVDYHEAWLAIAAGQATEEQRNA